MQNCTICNTPLPASNSKYCSKECATKHNLAVKRARHRATIPIRFCIVCNAQLVVRQKFYCSQTCKSKYEAGVRRLNLANGKRIRRSCAFCGEMFKIGEGYGKTCKSPQCLQDARDQRQAEKQSYIFTALCPGCGIHHQYDFSPGGWIGNGIPRVGCERYPQCAHSPKDIGDKFYITTIFESDNRAISL